MKEATFTSELMRSLRYEEIWPYKIPDAPITKAVLAVTRFTAAKPCDIIACYEGKFIAIECKQMKKWRAFSEKDMRPAQREMLDHIVDHGGKAFVFLNVRIKADKTKGQPREDRLIIFDWKVLRDELLLGSIKAKELRNKSYFGSFVSEQKKKVYYLTLWKVNQLWL